MKDTFSKKSPDYVLIILYLILITFGWLNLYSTNYGEQSFVFLQNAGKQLIWIIVSLIIAFAILLIDPLFFSTFAYGIYAIVILLLIAVLFVGKSIHGAKSWFEIFGAKFQPAELAKFATALALAKFISSNEFHWNFKYLKEISLTLSILFLPIILILLQPDLGSAIIFLSFIFPLYREGLQGYIVAIIFWIIFIAVISLVIKPIWLFLIFIFLAILFAFFSIKSKKIVGFGILIFFVVFLIIYIFSLILKLPVSYLPIYLIITTIITGLFFAYYSYIKNTSIPLLIIFFLLVSMTFSYSSSYFYNNILKEHQQKRIDVLLGKIDDPKGVGYNLRQAKIAISSGGLFGKGYLKGTITKYEFVPEADTDFIFCTIGEEWGFLGAAFVILLFFLLLARIIYLAEKQTSKFSRFYAYSVASIIFFHVVINIGMTVGLFPIIGIPLPFFSYGGSSLLGFTILIFILINLDTKRNIPL